MGNFAVEYKICLLGMSQNQTLPKFKSENFAKQNSFKAKCPLKLCNFSGIVSEDLVLSHQYIIISLWNRSIISHL